MHLSLGIGILFFEKLQQTIECISSFLPSGLNIYVLNNGSSLSSRLELGEFCKELDRVQLFDAPKNLGVAGGRNVLIEQAREEWLLFVDNDITINSADWPVRISRHIEISADAEVIIPRLFNVHDNSYVRYHSIEVVGNKAILSTPEGCALNSFPGGAAFVKKSIFQRLGPYDDKIFIGAEDFELSLRGILSGAPVKALLIDDIELLHDHRQVAKSDDIAAVKARYDVARIAASYQRIKEKHNVVLVDGWEVWVQRQAHELLHGKKQRGLFSTLKNFFS